MIDSKKDEEDTKSKSICYLCGLSFSPPERLQTHIRKEHPLFVWRGERSPYEIDNIDSKKDEEDTKSKSICYLCGLSFSPPERLQTHIRKEHPLFVWRGERSPYS